MNKKEKVLMEKFQQISKEVEPKTNSLKNCFYAFVVGGLLCDIGQLINNVLLNFGVSKDDVGTWVAIIMVFLGALLTGIGIYDKIGSWAGAGTVVPITGFANSIVSPAMEFKKEGYVFGVGAKMFSIAGPVLVYGVGSSIIVGIIYYLLTRW